MVPLNYDAMHALISRNIPGFQVRFKDEGPWQKVIAALVFVFNPFYLNHFTTTLYPTVWFPSQKWLEASPARAAKVLAHEYVHLWDRQRMGWFAFNHAYTAPQIYAAVALGSILAVVSPWALVLLGALIFLAPWPSAGRSFLEMRGYAMSLAVDYWQHGELSPAVKQTVASYFTGWAYWRMNWNALEVGGQISEIEAALVSGALLQGKDSAPYRDVFEVLQASQPQLPRAA